MVDLILHVHRIGDDLWLPIPADVARREGIRAGVPVRVTIERVKPKALGLLKDVLHGYHFDRRREGLYRGNEP